MLTKSEAERMKAAMRRCCVSISNPLGEKLIFRFRVVDIIDRFTEKPEKGARRRSKPEGLPREPLRTDLTNKIYGANRAKKSKA